MKLETIAMLSKPVTILASLEERASSEGFVLVLLPMVCNLLITFAVKWLVESQNTASLVP